MLSFVFFCVMLNLEVEAKNDLGQTAARIVRS